MSFYNSQLVKCSRKARRCNWCTQFIPQGSSYRYEAGIFEGDFFKSRLHLECHAAVQAHPDLEEGYNGDFARGRIDDNYEGKPQFNPDGTRTEEPL